MPPPGSVRGPSVVPRARQWKPTLTTNSKKSCYNCAGDNSCLAESRIAVTLSEESNDEVTCRRNDWSRDWLQSANARPLRVSLAARSVRDESICGLSQSMDHVSIGRLRRDCRRCCRWKCGCRCRNHPSSSAASGSRIVSGGFVTLDTPYRTSVHRSERQIDLNSASSSTTGITGAGRVTTDSGIGERAGGWPNSVTRAAASRPRNELNVS